jgi:BT1 family
MYYFTLILSYILAIVMNQFAMLCPEGSEGLVYAVLTTIMNLSGTVASDIGSAMTLIWDVSNET